MAQLKKEQYEKLKQYEKHLLAAYKNSFVHIGANDFMAVAGIYAEVFGESLRKSQMNCNTCRLNTLKKLGELYANYTESEKKKEAKKERMKKLEKENKDADQA